jgi:hypothetical protein
MNDFLNAIKVDLLDSRRRPMLMLAVAGLIAAVAFAVLAGGSSSSTPSTLGPEPTLGVSGLHVTQAQPTGNQAVAETTSGATQQHGGSSRDPFTPLPGALVSPTKSSTTSTTSSSSSSSGTTGGSGGGTSSPSPSRPKVKTTYRVAVLFGKTTRGTPATEQSLTPYENLRVNQLLPSKEDPLVAFRGVVAGASSGGHKVAFTLVGELIPRGPAICKPSAVNCQTVELEVGQTEELELLAANGEVLIYELAPVSVVTVTSAKAAAASHHSYTAGVSRPGSALLRRLGLLALPGLRYFAGTDALYAPARARAASHGHAAARR